MVMGKKFYAHSVPAKSQLIRALNNIGILFQCVSLLPSSASVYKYLVTKKKGRVQSFTYVRNCLFDSFLL